MEQKVKMLPMFPTPQKGESFYSVLCRYHVRSCNYSSESTIMQLFGHHVALNMTLLSPNKISYVSKWVSPQTQITPESMLYENTALALMAVTETAKDLQMMKEDVLIGSNHYSRRLGKINRRLLGLNKHLRFCPECVKEQREKIGTAYWEILPQISGYEFCPIHHCRILQSNIIVPQRLCKFYPAERILDSSEINPGYIFSYDEKAEHFCEESKNDLLMVARDLKWLFEQKEKAGSWEWFYLGLRNCLRRETHRIDFSAEFIAQRLKGRVSDPMLSLVFTLLRSFETDFGVVDHLKDFPVWLIVLLMRQLAGSPEAFYQGAREELRNPDNSLLLLYLNPDLLIFN